MGNVAIKLFKNDNTNKGIGINVADNTASISYALYVNGAANFTNQVTSSYGDKGFVAQHGTTNKDAGYKAVRSDTGTSIFFGVGTGGVNHGVYSDTLGKWMVYGDSTNVYLNGNAATATTATTANTATTSTNINVTDTTPTSQTTYYLHFSTGKSGAQVTRSNGDIYYWHNGSNAAINVGSSTTNGIVTFRNKTTYNIDLYGATATAARSIMLPNASGTVSLEGHTHNSVIDIGSSSNSTTFAYSKAGLGINDITWLACWNGYELRAINKSNLVVRYPWWSSGSGQNVNDLHGGTTFVYTNHNAGTVGTIASFDCSDNTNYTFQIMGGYNDGTLRWRHRNGDNGTWAAWKVAAGLEYANSYWGMTNPAGANNDWIRTTTVGIIPYQSGGAGSGHCGLGTSSWYFSYAYVDNYYGSWVGNTIPVTKGGTGATSAAAARANLDIVTTSPYTGISTTEVVVTSEAGTYSAFIASGVPGSSATSTCFIPKSTITSTAQEWQLTDEGHYIVFSLRISGSTLYAKVLRTNNGTKTISIAGLRGA